MRLSKDTIKSFKGNVVSLKLEGEKDLSDARIVWSTSNDAIVGIRDFKHGDNPFSDGVLLTLRGVGAAEVVAEYEGKRYMCPVECTTQQPKTDGELNYYIGDLHVHSSLDHKRESFLARTDCRAVDAIEAVRREGLLDFFVITDHAVLIDDKEFFRTFTACEANSDRETVIFGGAESEVSIYEKDSYGICHKNSGEVVTINTPGYKNAADWESLLDEVTQNEYAVLSFAHPQVIGWDPNGIWNFCFDSKFTERQKKAMKLIEIGNGDGEGAMLYEYSYSVALDNGFHVSPVSTSDCHGPDYGYYAWPGKTVIMAGEKSKEAFVDAMVNGRVYATESGNVKLFYSVNGLAAPSTAADTSRYRFHVEIGAIRGKSTDNISSVEVVSDGGRVIKTIENPEHTFDFEIESHTARYFYLRLYDAVGKRTISCPTYTGRACDRPRNPEEYLERIDKSGFEAWDILNNEPCGKLLNGNPVDGWICSGSKAEIEIDMKESKAICGIGIYPYRFIINDCLAMDDKEHRMQICLARFFRDYEISLSEDNVNYKKVCEGSVRVFGAEEYALFDEVNARYIRLKLLNTIGSTCKNDFYFTVCGRVGEIDIFKKSK